MGQCRAHASATPGLPHPYLRHTITFDTVAVPDDRVTYRNRALRRKTVLGMSPIDATAPASLRKATKDRPPGVLWSLATAAGVPVGLRARDFRDLAAAQRDVRKLLDKVRRLKVVYVADQEDHRAWWLTLDGEVVIVAASATKRSDVERQARSAVYGLRRIERDGGTATGPPELRRDG